MKLGACIGIALTVVAAQGCSKENAVDTSNHVSAGALGTQCSGRDDSGCGTAGICALGYCRLGCSTDGECPQGALCVGNEPPYGCQLEQDRACDGKDKICAPGLMCGIDGTCRTPCNPATRCPRNEQECIEGTCVAKSEGGALSSWFSCTTGEVRCNAADGSLEQCNGTKPGWGPALAGTKASCAPVGGSCLAEGAMCAGAKTSCVFGYCRTQCTTDAECPQGAICTGDKEPFGCQLSGDAPCSSSQPCEPPQVCGLDGVCRLSCRDTVSGDCPRNDQECRAGACVGKSEKGEGGQAYLSCADGEKRCGTDNANCGMGNCEVQECNKVTAGWGVAQTCTGDTPFCIEGKCVGFAAEPPGPMVQVPAPGGGTYGIDATEVTRAQYLKFLQERGGDTSGQPPECAWNTDFKPSANWPQTEWVPCGGGHYPITSVDWCDAHAYCAWAGKRLCGKIGGGPSPYAQGSESVSQLYNACTSGGQHQYPYGNAYDGEICNTADKGIMWPMEVGACSGCQSPDPGYAGVFDLIGNVAEWEDSCEGTAFADPCRISGGDTGIPQQGCFVAGGPARNMTWDRTGFRCCSSP